MNLSTRIAFRQLKSKHNFGFISISTILSIIGIMIGVTSLIIISSISDGFSEEINLKLSGIDGHLRIRSFYSEYLSAKEIDYIKVDIADINEINYAFPYIEKHAVIRNGDNSEGVIIYGIPEEAINNLFHLHNFTKSPPEFTEKQHIIIGRQLAEKLHLETGDNSILLNVENMIENQLIWAQNGLIANIFETNFPEYDRLLVFMPLESARTLFGLGELASGLLLNVLDPLKIEQVVAVVNEALSNSKLYTTTWKIRHSSLLNWLNVYDVPIKLIMLFITLVAVFNMAASLWMIILEKTRDIGILQSLGMKVSVIRKIIIKEGLIIGICGSISAVLLSFFLLFVVDSYQLIKLPPDIYFMDHLPIKITPSAFIIYPLAALILTIIFSLYPAMRASYIQPSEALKYE